MLAESLINHIVQKHFDSRPRPGWSATEVFFFNIRCHTGTYRVEFYKPCNYTAVMLRRVLERKGRDVVWSRPYLIAYHDSCWRSWFSEFNKTEPIYIDDLGQPGFGTMEVDQKEYHGYLDRDKYRFAEEVKKEVFCDKEAL